MCYKFLRKIFAERIVADLIVLKHIFGLKIKMNIKYLEIQNLSQWIDIFNKKQIANNFEYFTCILGILHVCRPRIKSLARSFTKHHDYYSFLFICFLKKTLFVLTLFLTKSYLLFYFQVPNGLHNYKSADALNRK